MFLLIHFKFNNTYIIVDTSKQLCQAKHHSCRTISEAFNSPITCRYGLHSLLGEFIENRTNANFNIIATSDTPFSTDSHPELLI